MYGFILMILTHDPSVRRAPVAAISGCMGLIDAPHCRSHLRTLTHLSLRVRVRLLFACRVGVAPTSQAGAWGTTDEEWPAEKKERALRQSLAYAINNPEAQLMRSWGIHAVWLVTFYWVFPVSWVLVTYCLYGVAFLFFFLGTCRLDCNDERVLDSADWFATVMTDLWSDAGSMFVDNGVDDSGNPLPGTGTVFPVWPYMGDRPHVVVGRALILAVLVNAVVGMLSDMLLFIRVVGMKTRHRHAAPAVAAAAAALPAPT